MPDLNTIPETKTADELAALKASDPAAFDLDDAPEQTEEEKAAAELAEKEAAEKAEADAAAKAEAEKAETDKKEEAIDRRKFDGVLGDLRDTRAGLAKERERADALAAELAALKAGPKVDYDEEIKALKEQWDDDKFDGTHDDFLEKLTGLTAAKAEVAATERVRAETAQELAEKALKEWDKAADAFVSSHDEYADKAGKDFLYFNAQLTREFTDNPNGTFDEWLTAAHDYAKTKALAEGRAQPATPAAAAAPADPNAARNAADAQAAAKASAAPAVIAGGVSSAGGPIANVDFANMKPGQFAKLSKDQQEAALGGPGAL